MLCASGTTVYAAEQPGCPARQAEVTDASGDETDAAVAEEAETLETEEDLDGGIQHDSRSREPSICLRSV